MFEVFRSASALIIRFGDCFSFSAVEFLDLGSNSEYWPLVVMAEIFGADSARIMTQIMFETLPQMMDPLVNFHCAH